MLCPPEDKAHSCLQIACRPRLTMQRSVTVNPYFAWPLDDTWKSVTSWSVTFTKQVLCWIGELKWPLVPDERPITWAELLISFRTHSGMRLPVAHPRNRHIYLTSDSCPGPAHAWYRHLEFQKRFEHHLVHPQTRGTRLPRDRGQHGQRGLQHELHRREHGAPGLSRCHRAESRSCTLEPSAGLSPGWCSSRRARARRTCAACRSGPAPLRESLSQ